MYLMNMDFDDIFDLNNYNKFLNEKGYLIGGLFSEIYKKLFDSILFKFASDLDKTIKCENCNHKFKIDFLDIYRNHGMAKCDKCGFLNGFYEMYFKIKKIEIDTYEFMYYLTKDDPAYLKAYSDFLKAYSDFVNFKTPKDAIDFIKSNIDLTTEILKAFDKLSNYEIKNFFEKSVNNLIKAFNEYY